MSENIYQIEFSNQAKKDLAKMPEQYRNRVQDKIVILAMDPYIGKVLEGEYKGLFSLRIWPYRIIYMVIKNRLLIEVVKIPHRQSAYKN